MVWRVVAAFLLCPSASKGAVDGTGVGGGGGMWEVWMASAQKSSRALVTEADGGVAAPAAAMSATATAGNITGGDISASVFKLSATT